MGQQCQQTGHAGHVDALLLALGKWRAGRGAGNAHVVYKPESFHQRLLLVLPGRHKEALQIQHIGARTSKAVPDTGKVLQRPHKVPRKRNCFWASVHHGTPEGGTYAARQPTGQQRVTLHMNSRLTWLADILRAAPCLCHCEPRQPPALLT